MKIIFSSQKLHVVKQTINNTFVYKVVVEGKEITLTKAMRSGGSSFWTSIPEGNQKLAEQLGKLIDDVIQNGEALF